MRYKQEPLGIISPTLKGCRLLWHRLKRGWRVYASIQSKDIVSPEQGLRDFLFVVQKKTSENHIRQTPT